MEALARKKKQSNLRLSNYNTEALVQKKKQLNLR